jgi:polysaccharide deacetylase 2 family uncharacterized protein YibQ
LARRKTKKRRKKSKRKSRKRTLFALSALKVLIGFAVLLSLVVAAGFFTHRYMLRKEPIKTSPAAKSKGTVDDTLAKIPPYERFPAKKPSHRLPPPQPKPPSALSLPKVAIIVDDLGYDRRMAKKFLEMDAAFTFSVLPHTTYTKSIAREASKHGREIMLHLPMEPLEFPQNDPGPGALLSAMGPDELIRQLKKNLAAVPGVKGVNNHMGSKMTADSTQMYQIFSVLKKQGLFFIDSRSTPETLGKPSARLFKVPFAERDVFIDHEYKPKFIRKQIKLLIQTARKNGKAVGIMHPSKTTYNILREMLPELKRQVQMVPASEVVEIIG